MRGNLDAFAGHSKEIVERHGGSPRAAEAAYWLGWSSLKRNKLKEAAERCRDAAARATKLGRKELAAAAMLESASA
ncbi:MAG: tetratricopeptide repeat protein, partial [Planctomycetota bacterium]